VDKDEKGATRERYVEHAIDVLTRDRELSVGTSTRWVDVEDGNAITGNSGRCAAARMPSTLRALSGGRRRLLHRATNRSCRKRPGPGPREADRIRLAEPLWGLEADRTLHRSLAEEGERPGYESRYGGTTGYFGRTRAGLLGTRQSFEGELAKLAFGQVWSAGAHAQGPGSERSRRGQLARAEAGDVAVAGRRQSRRAGAGVGGSRSAAQPIHHAGVAGAASSG